MAKSTNALTLLPDERPMLAAVIEAPADDQVKLVYADWLEERGDARGSYLRRCLAAAASGGPLPSAKGVSPAWLEMSGMALLRRLCEAGVAAQRSAVMALARPALAMGTKPPASEGRFPIGTTKFGGKPDLPLGSAWPRAEVAPLEFLAQLDLTEFRRTFAGAALPPGRLLSLFSYHDYGDDEYGNGRGEPYDRDDGLLILVVPEDAELTRLEPPADLTEDLGAPRPPCRVTYVEALDVPPSSSIWADEGPLREALGKLGEGRDDPMREARHQLFGYTRVTVLAGDPTPGKEWVQLIRFSSDDNPGWGWGDGHFLYWYVKPAELSRGDFREMQTIDG